MQKIIPTFSKNQVTKAGEILRMENPTKNEKEWAEEVLTNWRGIHLYPINTFRATLGIKLKRIDKDALIAQRLKRSPSIVLKLRRFEGMNLSRMQDIGGLRAVVRDIEKVKELESHYKKSRFLHKLVGEKDYIENPKDSGYRGIHLIYKYENLFAKQYNGLHVELQIRTKLQHIWATSVETMGTFLDYSLKSSEGPDEWLHFFALVSSAFAIMENTNKVPLFCELSDESTFIKVIQEAERLKVIDRFQAFRIAANKITNDVSNTGSYHIITLNLDEKLVKIKSYGRRRLEEANKDYSVYEEEILEGKNLQVVLVATASIESLKKAYPNYFLDTADFIEQLKIIENKVDNFVVG
jgi:putative GTP pyrophosphokinase